VQCLEAGLLAGKDMTDLVAVPSLLLADDNPVFLQALIEILEPDYEVVAALHEGASVLDKVIALCPDLVILDISLGDMTGLEVWRRVKAAGCTAKAIFVTVHEDIDFVKAAFDLGASGYVFKSRVSEDLQRAISTVFNGGRFVSGGLSLPSQAEK